MTSNIVQPAVMMMVLSGVVWLYMYVRRLGYIMAHGIDAQEVATPELMSAALPAAVNHPSNNLKNLFELPVLFYAVCALLAATQSADALSIKLAWAYVGLRALHSAVHCTVNIVMLRFAFYLLSSLVLWLMIGRLALAAFCST